MHSIFCLQLTPSRYICTIKQKKSYQPDDLPIYVFVAGVEGSGHHALETVWELLGYISNLSKYVYNSSIEILIIRNFMYIPEFIARINTVIPWINIRIT